MSEAKKAHIHRYYGAVDAADVEGVLDIFTPDATYRPRLPRHGGRGRTAGVLRG